MIRPLPCEPPTNQVCFLLAAGYFQARRKFFQRQCHAADVGFVAGQLGVPADAVDVTDYRKETYARHQRIILDYLGYCPFDKAAKTLFAKEIAQLVAVQFRPKLVLLESIDVLTRKKIEIPSYDEATGKSRPRCAGCASRGAAANDDPLRPPRSHELLSISA